MTERVSCFVLILLLLSKACTGFLAPLGTRPTGVTTPSPRRNLADLISPRTILAEAANGQTDSAESDVLEEVDVAIIGAGLGGTYRYQSNFRV